MSNKVKYLVDILFLSTLLVAQEKVVEVYCFQLHNDKVVSSATANSIINSALNDLEFVINSTFQTPIISTESFHYVTHAGTKVNQSIKGSIGLGANVDVESDISSLEIKQTKLTDLHWILDKPAIIENASNTDAVIFEVISTNLSSPEVKGFGDWVQVQLSLSVYYLDAESKSITSSEFAVYSFTGLNVAKAIADGLKEQIPILINKIITN